MVLESMKDKVQTVLGPVEPEDLGPTTTHEHLIIDFSFMLKMPKYEDNHYVDQPIELGNLGWIRHNHYSNKANLDVTDVKTAIDEATLYKEAGGGTIVDATTLGIGRNPDALAKISKESNVNVIMGAGYYVDAVHPSEMGLLKSEDIAQTIVNDITVGVGENAVKAGIIGEIGCTWPLTDNERKVLWGASYAQQETGAPILIHPGRNPSATSEILDELNKSGADIQRVIMGHLDRTIFDLDGLLELASSGCFLEWDLFGYEHSYYPLANLDMPSDAQRLDLIKSLVDRGFDDRIVIGQDICTNHRLVKYGGHGYGHIIKNIVPRMKSKEFSEESIYNIIVGNPSNILAFA